MKIFSLCRLLECINTSKWLKHKCFLFIYVISAYSCQYEEKKYLIEMSLKFQKNLL